MEKKSNKKWYKKIILIILILLILLIVISIIPTYTKYNLKTDEIIIEDTIVEYDENLIEYNNRVVINDKEEIQKFINSLTEVNKSFNAYNNQGGICQCLLRIKIKINENITIMAGANGHGHIYYKDKQPTRIEIPQLVLEYIKEILYK